MSRKNKDGTPAFLDWLAQSEDGLIDEYAFDVFELSKEQDPEKLKQISSFSQYARGRFATAKDEGELNKVRTKGARWNDTNLTRT